MGRRPSAQVRVLDIQIRAKVKQTTNGKNNAAAVKYVVRWVVDGIKKSRSFPLKLSSNLMSPAPRSIPGNQRAKAQSGTQVIRITE